jgi:hypothetical protein
MSEDRRAILQMLSDGKVTADEADRLIGALEGSSAGSAAGSASPSNGAAKPRPKYLRVVVDADEGGSPTKVNVRVPMQLLRAGVRLASIIPPHARDKVNEALAKNDMPFDINALKPENLEDLVDQLNELTVDVDQEHTKVRVFCE